MFCYAGNNPVNNFRDVSSDTPIYYPTYSSSSVYYTHDVAVLTINGGFLISSKKMCDDLADEVNGTSKMIEIPKTSFVEAWNSLTHDYVIIHMHGAPAVFQDNHGNNVFVIDDYPKLNRNNSIMCLFLCSCSTDAKSDHQYGNIASALSSKINPKGYTYASNGTVSGGDYEFTNKFGEWSIYQDGHYLMSAKVTTITVQIIASQMRNFGF